MLAVAREGALKIKEIGYIHAEGYSASALKHGPFALLEPGFPVVILAMDDIYFDKCINAMEEIKSRGAHIILITNQTVRINLDPPHHIIRLPTSTQTTGDILAVIPLQILACQIAVSKGINPDFPRNLAKVVTVNGIVCFPNNRGSYPEITQDIQNILRETPSDRQTTLFSATMPKPIRRLADNYMNTPQSVTIKRKQLTVATTEQRYYLVNEKDKLAALTRLFEVEEVGATLVFTRTRVGSSHLANELIQRGFPAEALNGDLEQDARIRVLNRFRTGRIKVLVATDVAARGLDIDDISHVFNFDLPGDPEAYVHRIGRTGRAGKEGIAISLVTPGERRGLNRIERYTKQQVSQADLPTEKDIHERREKLLIEKMAVWLERDRCKREQEIVEEMVAAGYDPIKVAATALKMAQVEEKQRPIEKIGEVRLKRPKSKYESRKHAPRNGKGKNYRKREQRRRNGKSDGSHEEGMVRLSLGRGRLHGISPSEVVGAIASRADIPGYVIGKILIRDQNTLVDVPEEFVSRVLGQTGSYNFRRHQNVTIERATI